MTDRLSSLAIAFLLGCALAPRPAHAITKYECRNGAGQRVQYADTAAQCPTGTTAYTYTVPNACDIGMCVTGPTPPDAVPVGLLCCAYVSGEPDCVEVEFASDCPADEYLATCLWGQTNEDGSVTCYD